MTRRWLIRPEIKGIRMTADGKQAAGHQLSSLISCVYFIPWDLWTVYFSPSSLQKLGQLLAGRSAAAPLLASSHQCPCCLPLSSSQKDQIINLVGSHHSPQLSRDFLLQEQNLNSSFQSWGPTTHPLPLYSSHVGPRAFAFAFPTMSALLHFAPLPLDHSSATMSLPRSPSWLLSSLGSMFFFFSAHFLFCN